MAFPRKLLAPGEQIVLEAHPNWSILLPRLALAVAVIAGCVAVAVYWSSAPLWVGYVLLGAGLLGLAGVLAKVVKWRSTTLVITTARVVYRTGVLRRLGREIPLNRIQDVTYRQGLVERMLGVGSLTVESAGQAGREPFPDIAHPASVQSLINSLTFDSGCRTRPEQWQPPPLGNPTEEYLRYPEDSRAFRRPCASESRPAPSAGVGGQANMAADFPAPIVLTPRWVAATRERPSAVDADDAIRSLNEELAHLARLNQLGVITDAELAEQSRQLLGRE
jgi:membrane protein YdbS with pleckstrin-like domain